MFSWSERVGARQIRLGHVLECAYPLWIGKDQQGSGVQKQTIDTLPQITAICDKLVRDVTPISDNLRHVCLFLWPFCFFTRLVEIVQMYHQGEGRSGDLNTSKTLRIFWGYFVL